MKIEEGEESGTPAHASEHLADLPSGSGCTEIWEYLSEQREGDDDRDD